MSRDGNRFPLRFLRAGQKAVPQERQLRCLIQGANATFRVPILEDKDIDALKEKIHQVSHPITLGGSTANDLVLLKVRHEMGPALIC
jgi:hypothetical protein